MISLKNIMKGGKWNDKNIEFGKVYSNPYHTAFKPDAYMPLTGQFYLQDQFLNYMH